MSTLGEEGSQICVELALPSTPRRRFYDHLPVNDRELEVSSGVSGMSGADSKVSFR
jgi:hypothetical protein